MRNHNSILNRLKQLEKQLDEKISPVESYIFINFSNEEKIDLSDPRYKNAEITIITFSDPPKEPKQPMIKIENTIKPIHHETPIVNPEVNMKESQQPEMTPLENLIDSKRNPVSEWE